MAKIPLSKNTYTIIPEGDYVFECLTSTYDENFGKIKLELECSAGKYSEKYNLLGTNGEMNDGAYKAFSYTAKCMLNDMDAEEVDSDMLVGLKMIATVEHNVVPHQDTGKPMTFVNLKNKEVYNGEEIITEKVTPDVVSKTPSFTSLLDKLNG